MRRQKNDFKAGLRYKITPHNNVTSFSPIPESLKQVVNNSRTPIRTFDPMVKHS